MKWDCRTAPRDKLMRSIAVTLASVALVASTPALAGGAHSLFIMDANTGATLTDIEGNDPRYPASLTKMMTLYLAFEAVEQGRASMKTPIKINLAATRAAPSKLDLAVGDEITLENAVMALITKSANDVAIAVAEHLGGTEANFAKLMTAKARELGMKATTFKNASGLPDSDQTTTARDMTTLGIRLYDDFPRYFPLFSTRAHTYNGSTFRNHNTLMLQMPGINGIKTGYTHASGFNLVSSLQQDGRHLVGAIFGGETAGSRNAQMRVALTRALAKASANKTRKPVLVARAEAKAAADAGKKAKPAVVAVAKAAPTPAAIQVATTATTSTPSSLKIAMAKVRPTSLSSAATATPPPTYAQASATPKISDLVSQRLTKATEPATRPIASPLTSSPVEQALRQPSSFETQMASLAQNIQPPTTAPTSVPDIAPAPSVSARPPSSLSAQMAGLTQSPAKIPAPSFRLNGPAASPPAPSAHGFEIQIGAFSTPAEANKKLAAAQGQLSSLKAHTPLTQSVTVGEKTLYRARFAGFDQPAATEACVQLNRLAINCLALKAE